jgi:hypothetical protein
VVKSAGENQRNYRVFDGATGEVRGVGKGLMADYQYFNMEMLRLSEKREWVLLHVPSQLLYTMIFQPSFLAKFHWLYTFYKTRIFSTLKKSKLSLV